MRRHSTDDLPTVKARTLVISALITVGVAVIAFLGFWNFVAPRMVVDEIKKGMAEGCITCRLAIDHPDLGLFPGATVHLTDVSFYGGERNFSDVQIVADSIDIRWHPLSLLKKQLVIQSVDVVNPLVVLSEGDSPSRFKKDEEKKEKRQPEWTFEVERTAVTGATFTYNRVHNGHKGSVHVTDISATASRWGRTSDELRKSVGEAVIKGVVEKSGHAILRIAMPVLETEKQHIDIDFSVEGFHLDELTYLPACEGVSLKGDLVSGHGQVFVRDRLYNAKTRVEYKDLDVTLVRTEAQGELAVFFGNLMTDLMLRKKDLDRSPNEQTRETNGERGPHESIAHFILRGLKESAMKVALPHVKPAKAKK